MTKMIGGAESCSRKQQLGFTFEHYVVIKVQHIIRWTWGGKYQSSEQPNELQ